MTDKAESTSSKVHQNTSDGRPAQREYPVGYQKPPLHTRFKKGQVRNPRGRPKPKKTIIEIFKRVIAEKITVYQGDSSERITKGHAILRANFLEAIKGGRRAMDNLFRLIDQVGAFDDVPVQDRPRVLLPERISSEEFQLLADAANRASKRQAELRAQGKIE